MLCGPVHYSRICLPKYARILQILCQLLKTFFGELVHELIVVAQVVTDDWQFDLNETEVYVLCDLAVLQLISVRYPIKFRLHRQQNELKQFFS